MANWEHAHLFMDDSGVVVAESDLSSQEITLAGGGGGSLPSEWVVDSAGNLDIQSTSLPGDGIATIKGEQNGQLAFSLGDYGDLTLPGLSGQGPGGIFISSLDSPGTQLTLYGGDSGSGGFDMIQVQNPGAYRVFVATSDQKLGFFNQTSTTQPNVPLTTPDVQDVIDALVLLGLVEQSD
jgi:hypothetical protein